MITERVMMLLPEGFYGVCDRETRTILVECNIAADKVLLLLGELDEGVKGLTRRMVCPLGAVHISPSPTLSRPI